ncbi:3-deoxy-D-manno-octulosonic acid transferase [Falsirhodobacter sp. alg1]|uniref:3-deoxy-D-manno-octulosonic acid transferase n=1 Tax=Falsirhodobacter sp. alg1 TaxID=1472418 RepID=UPI0007872CCA|nr:glycosyltransferase N-terminal domain-containing protein [Falsirhodobacter sp. alg1]
MAHLFGLTLYALANRREAARTALPDRPKGRLVWIHAPGEDCARTGAELARRLTEDLDVASIITDTETAPHDSMADVKVFLDHLRPDACVFLGGEVRPALLAEANLRGIPLMMADAHAPTLPPGVRWVPGILHSTLDRFAHILTLDESAARSFRRAGADADTVKVAGRMEEPHGTLSCTEAERLELAATLATRPIWLAASLPQIEEDAVILAHRAALTLSHRLLLIVVPAVPERATILAERMEAAGLSVAQRAAEDEILPETEVYIADNAEELGLWYRLAPICFLGGSLTTGALRDPLEGAALGSALIHGTSAGEHAGTFARLAGRRASLPVAHPRALADALADLMSPERVAELAGAAWEVASDGGEVTDRVLALIDRMLEDR